MTAISWTLYVLREQNSTSNFSTRSGDAKADLWETSGWSAGASGQATLRGGDLLLTTTMRYVKLSGTAQHHEVDGIPFAADESRVTMIAELRLLPGGPWEAATVVGVSHEGRRRSDGLAEVFSDLRAWRPTCAFEVVRWFGNKLAVSAGGAVAEHNPTGTIPRATAMSAAYGNWIAPELALEASGARGRAAAVTLRWQARATTAFWVQGRHFVVSPAEGATVSLQHLPGGDRTGWTVAVGAVLGGR
jgi:hypothetical protein